MIFIIILVIVVILVIVEIIKNKNKSDNVQNISVCLENYLKEHNIKQNNLIEFSEEVEEKGNRFNNYTKIYIEDNQKKLFIFSYNDFIPYLVEPSIIEFSKIIECEILEDNSTILKGGVGRAIVGGAISGGVGAVVGATTRKSKNIVSDLKIRIITKDINNPLILLPIITKDIERTSKNYDYLYNIANKIYATIISIIENEKENIK